MTDLKTPANPLFLREDELRHGIELLFYAYRDFTGTADRMLATYKFGRAHHRVLHFIASRRGMTVSELLGILKITKQSLSRVLRALIAQGFVEQRQGARDRRQRQLYLSDKGQSLERELAREQQARVARAFREAGADAVAGYRKVLLGLIDDTDRAAIQRLPVRR
jgi:DNA-binding MarR family transcriptional regulator